MVDTVEERSEGRHNRERKKKHTWKPHELPQKGKDTFEFVVLFVVSAHS
jgi:hypothetical protein